MRGALKENNGVCVCVDISMYFIFPRLNQQTSFIPPSFLRFHPLILLLHVSRLRFQVAFNRIIIIY